MYLSQDLWVVHVAEYFLQGHYQATTPTASLNNPVKITSNALIKKHFFHQVNHFKDICGCCDGHYKCW